MSGQNNQMTSEETAADWDDGEATKPNQGNPERDAFDDDMFSFLDQADEYGHVENEGEIDDGAAGAAAGDTSSTDLPADGAAVGQPGQAQGAVTTSPPVTAPAAQAPAAPTTTEQPAAQTVQTTAAAAPVVQQVAVPTPVAYTQEQLAQIEERRAQYIDKLTQEYAFTEEETTQMLHSPEVVLPKKLAQMQANIVTSIMQAVTSNFSQLAQQHAVTTQRQTEARKAFFGAFPKLEPLEAEHGETMRDMVRVVASRAKPGTQPDQIIKTAGSALMAMFGIPMLEGTPPATAQTQQPQRKPNAPLTPPGTRTSAGQATIKSDNYFTQVSDEWDDF